MIVIIHSILVKTENRYPQVLKQSDMEMGKNRFLTIQLKTNQFLVELKSVEMDIHGQN